MSLALLLAAPLPIHSDPLAHWQIAAGYLVFALSYLVFALGKFPGLKIDRPGMAIIGAVLMVAFGVVSARQALGSIDFATLVLLFSMMLVVGCLRLSGFFDWITEHIVARLTPRNLLPATIFITGILAAFFVNDIICLVMVPFALTASRRMGLKPLPYLLAVATASNIGSVATITGNPQNMLIGSYSGLGYRYFLAHLGPVALIGLIIDWLLIRWLCGAENREEPQANDKNKDVVSLEHPVVGLGHPIDSTLGHPVVGLGHPIDSSLGHPVVSLGHPIESGIGHPTHLSAMRKPAIVIALVLAGFLAGVPPAMMAAIGAALMLVTRTREPRQVYDEVDWGLLVFFVGLFLIVGGAERAGLNRDLFDLAARLNLQNVGIFTAVTALFSNLVSNVPAVMLLKSVVPGFRNPHSGWMALAMASTLAGNLTITGSVANLIVVERARDEVRIGFWDYSRVGIPVTLLTLAVGWAWLTWVA